MRAGWTTLLAGASLFAIGSAAHAGGFDRGGVNIDQLYDAAQYSSEAGVTYVSPQRTLKNVRRLDGTGTSSAEVKVDGDYTVPRIGLKANVFEPVDCLGTYTQPYGVDARYGANNAYSPTATQFSVSTEDYGLTCSYKFAVGPGQMRFIGGVSYQKADAFLERQTLQTFAVPFPAPIGPRIFRNPGLGTFQLSDEAWSWRAGAAYEMPEYALRASVLYSARYNYDDLTGTVDTRGFAVGPTNPIGPPGAFLGVRNVNAASEIPQALEFKLQTGIAPDWLAFGSVKWQDWSQLGVIPIYGVISPVTGRTSKVSFDPLYRDGWTVTGGVGHKFSDMVSAGGSVTWDRGTSTGEGYQTDSWNFALGTTLTPAKAFEVRLGGSVGVLTSGSSRYSGVGDQANAVQYDFGNDVVYGLSASAKLKF